MESGVYLLMMGNVTVLIKGTNLSIEPDPESAKKVCLYTDPDFTGIKNVYNDNDKGLSSLHISKSESVERLGSSIRLLNCA